MSPDRDPGRFDDDRDPTDYEDETPRSIFSALWFRAVLVMLVLGVLAAVAVPYILDFATTPGQVKGGAAKSTASAPAPAASSAKGASAPPTPAPATAPAAVATAAPAAVPAPPAAEPAPATARPTARPKSEPPAPAAAKPAPAKPAPPKPAAVKPAPKPEPAKAPAVVARAVETPKPAPKSTEPKEPKGPKAAAPKATAAAATGGAFWVQVCAYKDAETAKRVATRLRGQGLNVEESTTTVSASAPAAPAARPSAPAVPTSAPAAKPVSDRYDVIVSGAAAADVDAKVSSKGMTSETTSSGIVVRPSLALRDAVALSRDLADSGMNVQVRRVNAPAPSPEPTPPPAPAPAATAPTGGQTLHRVRVGSFPDRAGAVTAMKQLEDKGFKPFITPGGR